LKGQGRQTEQQETGNHDAVDDQKGLLYIGEESVGVWRYDLDPTSSNPRSLIAGAPSTMLQPDVEGIALLREGAKTWLIVSSQGDSAFALWQVDGPEPDYRGRFSVISAGGVDGVTGTDGVAAIGGIVGQYGEGLIVVQDDVDDAGETSTMNRVKQNFKLVDWRSVKAALKLDAP
jgi:3-phytase